MRAYELMTIFRPELAEADVRNEVAALEQALTDRGATIKSSDFWGKRRFAYEIKHLHEGYYSVTQFDGESDAVEELDRALGLLDHVVRHKFFRPE